MASVTRYIENRLLLKVNRNKSKIGRPTDIKYLGFTFYNLFKRRNIKQKYIRIQKKLKKSSGSLHAEIGV